MVLTGTAFDILWSTVCVCEVATVVSVIRFVKRFTTASPSSPCLPPPCRQLMQKSKVLEDDGARFPTFSVSQVARLLLRVVALCATLHVCE